MNSASLCSLAGRYDNPIPPRFLAPIDFLKIPAQGATTPPPSTRGKAGRNHMNEEFTPLLPTGIGERFSQTISNLGHAALLRRFELLV
jgi:hypothetical protein